MPTTTKRGAEATSQDNCTKRRKISQEYKVLWHMKNYGSITSMQAFRSYEITRLAAKVFELRRKGYNIITLNETKNGTTYARYILKEETNEF